MSSRPVILATVGFIWTILCVYLAVWISQNGNQTTGMIAGTLMSGVAFVPPALLLTRWYQRQQEKDRRDRRPPSSSDDPRQG